MGKNYQRIESETTTMAAEPVNAYDIRSNYQAPQHAAQDSVMANTMSVDEYFDRLITLVHNDGISTFDYSHT